MVQKVCPSYLYEMDWERESFSVRLGQYSHLLIYLAWQYTVNLNVVQMFMGVYVCCILFFLVRLLLVFEN